MFLYKSIQLFGSDTLSRFTLLNGTINHITHCCLRNCLQKLFSTPERRIISDCRFISHLWFGDLRRIWFRLIHYLQILLLQSYIIIISIQLLFLNFLPRIRIVHHILKLSDSFLLFHRKRCRIPRSNNNTGFIRQRLIEYFSIAGGKQTELQ